MDYQENISENLQQNLLTLLVFDSFSASIISSTLDINLLDNIFYKNIAKKAIAYYNEFKESCSEHVSDLLEKELNDEKVKDVYGKIILNLYDNKENVNSKYILSQLNTFINEQSLKVSVIEAASAIKSGNSEEAREILRKASTVQMGVFDPGIDLTNTSRSLDFLNKDMQAFPMGIKPLDDLNIGPVRGELLTIIAPPNAGKTSFMTHIGCTNGRIGNKVLHISLEMSEEKMCRKYYQTLFSVSTTKDESRITKIVSDSYGYFDGVNFEHLKRPLIRNETEGVREYLSKKMNPFKNRLKVKIKRFPTGALTIIGLESYLDSLEKFYNYVPDILLVDYADLLKVNANNLRIDLGNIYKDLRRIIVERNIAGVTATQANRSALEAKIIGMEHIAEDLSKAAISDTLIALCQTKQERKLSLMRLFVAKARDEERDQQILISQCLRFGQFCMSSALMREDAYWNILDKEAKEMGEIKKKPFTRKKED